VRDQDMTVNGFAGTTRRPTQAALAAAILPALLLCGCGSSTRGLPYAAPESVGVDGAALRSAADVYRAAVERDDVRGAVLLVARRGHVITHEAVGWRDKEGGLPMQTDTLFRMASNTKPLTATGVLMLAEEGRVTLNAPLGDYLPAYRQGRNASIRVDHLLTHTSGYQIDGNLNHFYPVLQASPEHPDAPRLGIEIDRLAAVGPVTEPGTVYSYSNAGYNMLAALIEARSGLWLEPFFETRIFGPLGMVDSAAWEPSADPQRMATTYQRVAGQWRVTWQPGGLASNWFPSGAAGVVSSSTDYALFCQAFLNGGTYAGVRLLSAESVRLATQPCTRPLYTAAQQAEATRWFYGYGWNVRSDGSYYHGGAHGTWAYIEPAQELIILVFTQSVGGSNPRDEYVARVHAALR